MHSYLKKQIARFEHRFFGSAERLDAEDNSMDAVVSTLFYAQCQIYIAEVLRVLKPVDAFIYRTRRRPKRNFATHKVELNRFGK